MLITKPSWYLQTTNSCGLGSMQQNACMLPQWSCAGHTQHSAKPHTRRCQMLITKPSWYLH